LSSWRWSSSTRISVGSEPSTAAAAAAADAAAGGADLDLRRASIRLLMRPIAVLLRDPPAQRSGRALDEAGGGVERVAAVVAEAAEDEDVAVRADVGAVMQRQRAEQGALRQAGRPEPQVLEHAGEVVLERVEL
jgi:hypothetical protein